MPHRGSATYASILELAEKTRGPDKAGYRGEFLRMVRQARLLQGH